MLAQRCEPNLFATISDMQKYNGLPTLQDQRCNTIWIHCMQDKLCQHATYNGGVVV